MDYMTNIKTDENGNYLYDSNGNLISEEMTEAEKAQKQLKIAEFEGKLNEGKSFDELIAEYSEFDTKNYPNGFYFSVNEIDIWGNDIYNAVKSAEINSVTSVKEEEAIFYIQKLELEDEHLETLVDVARAIDGVRIAMSVRQSTAQRSFRISLRSSCAFDVSVVAKNFSGGGHSKAAACTIEADSIEFATKLVVDEIMKYWGKF